MQYIAKEYGWIFFSWNHGGKNGVILALFFLTGFYRQFLPPLFDHTYFFRFSFPGFDGITVAQLHHNNHLKIIMLRIPSHLTWTFGLNYSEIPFSFEELLFILYTPDFVGSNLFWLDYPFSKSYPNRNDYSNKYWLALSLPRSAAVIQNFQITESSCNSLSIEYLVQIIRLLFFFSFYQNLIIFKLKICFSLQKTSHMAARCWINVYFCFRRIQHVFSCTFFISASPFKTLIKLKAKSNAPPTEIPVTRFPSITEWTFSYVPPKSPFKPGTQVYFLPW